MRDAGGNDDDGDARLGARWASVAFALGCLSALVYFASSEGIHNFATFLVEGLVKFARLFGLSA